MTTNNTPGLCLDSGEFIPASELAAGSPLAAVQATAAQAAAPTNAITAAIMRDDGGEAPAFCLMAAYRSEKDAMDAFALIAAAPAQPVAEPAGAASEMVKFTDQSAANPIEKARRYLAHVANKKPNNPYFFDDGYPRESIADDAAAALSVLEQIAASHGQAQSPEGPQAASLAEAVRDVGKWLNERPNRPLDLRSVAMLCAHAQQADSQPAPVAGEPTWMVFNSVAQEAEVESLAEAMEYLTPERLSRQWCAVCVVDQSNMPQTRTASAPAESVTAPPPPPECETEAEKRAFAFGWFKALESERMKADSVLEDAARLDWLLLRVSGAEFRRIGVHYSGNARRADVDAARKQGEKQ